MAAICTTQDGDTIFVSAENGGNQVILSAARTDLSTWTEVYTPGGGSAANVVMSPDPDTVYFYGNFGTDVTVIKHTVSTGAETDISPAGLGAKVVNTLVVNPSDVDELVITVDTDQDLKHTVDGGSNWVDLDAALGFDATALAVLFSGRYAPLRYFVAGDNTTDLDVLYSPNAGASSVDKAGTALGAETDICSIEVTEA